MDRHGARRHEAHFLAVPPLRQDPLIGQCQAGLEQLADGAQRIGRQSLEQRHALDEFGRAHFDVQRRVLVDVRPAAFQLLGQVRIDFAADQELLKHVAIADAFELAGHAAQITFLQPLGVRRILQVQRLQGVFDQIQTALVQRHDALRGLFAKQRCDLLARKGDQALRDRALAHQVGKALAKLARQPALKAEQVMQPQCQPETRRIADIGGNGALEAFDAAQPDRVFQPFGPRQQGFGHAPVHDLRLQDVEEHFLFALGNHGQSHGHALLVGHLADPPVVHAGQAGVEHRADTVADFVADVLGLGHFLGLALQIFQRHGQHLIADGALDRRQLVQPQHANQRPQADAVDEQGHQHKARGGHGDELARLFGHAHLLGHRQRQRQRHGAAQSAPQHHHLVGIADLGAQPGQTQQRKQPKHHDRPRDQRHHEHHTHQHQFLPIGRRHQLRDQHGREQEDEGIGPETKLLPGAGQVFEGGRRHAGAAGGPDHQARDHGGDHARHVQVMLGDEEGQIGQRQRQGDLGRGKAAQPGEQKAGQAPHRKPGHAAADEVHDEVIEDAADGQFAFAAKHGQQHGIQGNGRRVVEQAFALDQRRQALGRAHLAEDPDHCHRIRRRHDGAQQQAND